MLQSELFTRTLREAPKDELSKNAQFLIRGGFIDKLSAGVYTFLPLGLLVLKKIEAIIREEMHAIGGQEVLMPALHPLENYEATGREAIDVLYHIESDASQKMVLGQSHEEIVVPLVKKFVDSYRDLPLAVFQIQTKFRNELRPKSGIFRGREFIMKDLYSFHTDEQDFESYYKKATEAYKKVFERVGIGAKTYFTYASGGTFSKYSHEFQTISDAGEDTIYVCNACSIGVNKEIFSDVDGACPECKSKDLKALRAIEVGNIFPLKSRFSDPFDLSFTDAAGKRHPVVMGCYGIGISRLMGVIAELLCDDRGIVWPESVAPFRVHVISIASDDSEANKLYDRLKRENISALYDNREGKTPGEKFADADLLGIPWRVVVSDKTIKEGKIEVKKRASTDVALIDADSFLKLL